MDLLLLGTPAYRVTALSVISAGGGGLFTEFLLFIGFVIGAGEKTDAGLVAGFLLMLLRKTPGRELLRVPAPRQQQPLVMQHARGAWS
jgi:hypothetical protein